MLQRTSQPRVRLSGGSPKPRTRGARGTYSPPGRPNSAALPPEAGAPPYHFLSALEACAHQGTHPENGLTAAEVKARLLRDGPNRLLAAPRAPLWRLLLAQFDDFMVLVLLGAATVSFVLGEHADALAVLAIVAINAALGFAQETRAEKSLDALRRLAAPAARVVRDGRVQTVAAEEVVPGDLLLLEAGDRTAADARILDTVSLAVEESALTGESRPVAKNGAPLPRSSGQPSPTVEASAPAAPRRRTAGAADAPRGDVPPGDRRNMVFQGSHIVRGRARVVVTATGMSTEVGRIAGLILDAGFVATPLQRRLDALGRVLVLACLGISCAVVLAGVLQGEEPYRMFLAGVSLAVAAIPEGLPAIVTIALALGVQRMIARHAIVRRLPAVETLGCATVVCSDKTGTLTQNVMAVQRLFAGGWLYRVEPDGILAPEDDGLALIPGPIRTGPQPFQRRKGVADTERVGAGAELEAPRDIRASLALAACLRVAVLCNDATLSGSAAADPTETALLGLAVAAGQAPDVVRAEHPRLGEIPFESERRRMTVLCGGVDGARILIKGAVEEVLPRCVWVQTPTGRQALDARWTARIRQQGEGMAEGALRVLALAEREWPARSGSGSGGGNGTEGRPEEAELAAVERDLVFCGLVGMIDPPRSEVPAAIRRCQQAGVRAVMITGDHALTARAIARQIGLLSPDGRVVSGRELAEMSERELASVVEEVAVFARVSPADKLRIVRALRGRGHVVAMTGDGVNDAPAVKEADIGVAMGRTGTDVTREASALVLTDDNFATIVAAIEEGRAIYDNIRKFIRYLLACNTGEVLVMLLGALLGLPLPLLPLQLLLVNLVTDGLPALALGVDPPSADVMRRPPRAPREGVFAGGLGKRIAVRGGLIGLLSLGAFGTILARGGDLSVARTAATCTLVLSQLLHAFDARAERRTLWEVGWGGNRALLLAVASSLGILLLMLYLPPARQLFHFAAPSAADWMVVVLAAGAGAAVAGAGEAVRRAWVRRTALVRVRRA